MRQVGCVCWKLWNKTKKQTKTKREPTQVCHQNAVDSSRDDLIWWKIPLQQRFWHSKARNLGLWKKNTHVEEGQQMYEANGFWSLHNDAVSRSHMNKQGRRRRVWCEQSWVFTFLYVSIPHAAPSGAAGAADPVVTSDLGGQKQRRLFQRLSRTVGSERIQTPLNFSLCHSAAILWNQLSSLFSSFKQTQHPILSEKHRPFADLLHNKHWNITWP